MGSTQAIVLADGDIASRVAIDAAWPGWCESEPYVIAADGGARHAGPLGLRIDRWVGDGDLLGEAGLAALAAQGVPIERAPFDKDASDTELAVVAALARGPSSLTILGALGGPRLDHALANLALLELPSSRDIDMRLVAADARVRLLVAPAPDGSPARLELTGRVDDLVSLLPLGGDVEGVTTEALAFPLDDESLLAGRTRGLSNSAAGTDGGRHAPGRPTPRRRDPCYALDMSMPTVGDSAPPISLPDETGTVHDLADQRGRWTILYFYPKDDTPGCTVEACEFRDAIPAISERGADVWGVSPQGSASKRSFREKFDLPFTLLADEQHAAAEVYGSWVEKQNYGRTYMGTARTTFLVDPDGRIARVWPKVKPEGHAAEVMAALDELQAVAR